MKYRLLVSSRRSNYQRTNTIVCNTDQQFVEGCLQRALALNLEGARFWMEPVE